MKNGAVLAYEGAAQPAATKKRSQLHSIWRRFRKNKLAMFGLILLAIVVFFAVFADMFSDYEEDVIFQDLSSRLQPNAPGHILGTDAYGRDIFARIIYGARISLTMCITTVAVSLVLGCIFGAIAAYYGGWIDNVIMRVTDVFLAIPQMLMAVTIVAALGTGVFNLGLALTISMIPPFARIVRSAVLQVKGQEYIEAAQAYGTQDVRIITKHVLPNAIGPIIVQATLNMANTLLSISALGFIGLGIPSPLPEWGSMLAESKDMMRYNPYLVIYPGLAIVIAVLGLNLIGDGLRDALDPRLKN